MEHRRKASAAEEKKSLVEQRRKAGKAEKKKLAPPTQKPKNQNTPGQVHPIARS
jgi:hypothetical protein